MAARRKVVEETGDVPTEGPGVPAEAPEDVPLPEGVLVGDHPELVGGRRGERGVAAAPPRPVTKPLPYPVPLDLDRDEVPDGLVNELCRLLRVRERSVVDEDLKQALRNRHQEIFGFEFRDTVVDLTTWAVLLPVLRPGDISPYVGVVQRALSLDDHNRFDETLRQKVLEYREALDLPAIDWVDAEMWAQLLEAPGS